jgi:hypothetical protein
MLNSKMIENKKMKFLNTVLILLGLIISMNYACNDSKNSYCNLSNSTTPLDSCNNLDFNTGNFNIVKLTEKDLPYIEGWGTINDHPYKDSDSIPLFEFKQQLYYHPVMLVQHALLMLDVLNTTKDSSYIPRILTVADKLLSISISIDSSLYLPYLFDFSVHDCPNESMKTPWYSSMAQGQALSLMCRLYEITSDEKYKIASANFFNSLCKLKANSPKNWTACVDSNKNLWFEEYPHNIPFHTLNGMIFTIYGIYDYYLMTENKKAEELLQAGLLTIKTNLPRFRNKHRSSSYCLKHLFIAPSYHKIHVKQLQTLSKLTGDSIFKRYVKLFKSDYQE